MPADWSIAARQAVGAVNAERGHGLSDPKLEPALKVRLDFMLFCELDLHAPVPDETTHCRFRNALVRGRLRRSAGRGLCL